MGLFIVVAFVALLGSSAEQQPWTGATVEGLGTENGRPDYTEGVGAFTNLRLKPGTKNFDNGGGSHDTNTLFLRDTYAIENWVYDPFQRSKEHNETVLEAVAHHDFDTSTSNSVLNVIDDFSQRLRHIFLSCDSLKEFGAAYFLIWEGDRSSEEKRLSYGYQANRLVGSYQSEIERIFGSGNVVTDFQRKLIIAFKNGGCNQTK
ncbi:MAG TPA: hypothetical protein VLF94_04640 [Chlamydiales bacterium]|nr:hypothetical protein [Chlamydiales bacterium]